MTSSLALEPLEIVDAGAPDAGKPDAGAPADAAVPDAAAPETDADAPDAEPVAPAEPVRLAPADGCSMHAPRRASFGAQGLFAVVGLGLIAARRRRR